MATVTTLEEALAVLNTAYEKLGYAPEGTNFITADNLDTIGALPPNQISAILEMVMLITQQRVFKTTFDASSNPARKYFIDLKSEGFGILDVYQEIIDGVEPMWLNTDDSEVYTDLVSRADEKIQKRYHTAPFAQQFKTTVDEREYSKVFTTTGLPAFIDTKIANLGTSAELYIRDHVFSDELKHMGDNGDCVVKSGYDLQTVDGIKKTIEAINAVAKDMPLATDKYNKDGIISDTPMERLSLITTPAAMERLKVNVYAGAYNLDETKLPYDIVYMPNGTDLGTVSTGDATTEDVLFWLVDNRAVFAGIKTYQMTSFKIANTLRTNYWLSIEGISSHNTFINAVAFTGNFTQA